MKRRSHFILLAFLVFLCGLPGRSAAQPQGGDNELQLTGSFFRSTGSGEGALNADVVYSYFLEWPNWEIGLRQSIVYNYNSEEEDTWNAVTAPFFNYNFLGISHRHELVPYIGALLGAVYNDDDITGTTGPQAGVKWYVSDSTFLVANYRYEWFFNELSNANDSQDANHVVAFGIGYNWGGGRQ
jgi:hypothetical protein